ncbi:MAG TPA: hypothetical protein VLI39_19415 [Sedimentisphaerales bacterium]|nr:hypothetical protein [Sedimentisphaerales bacterium]
MASRVEISKRLLFINSASSIAAQVLQFSVLVWLHQHLLRRVSADEYSLYPLVMAIVGFVPLFTMVLTSGLGRYLVDAYARGDDERVSRIVSSMVPPLFVVGGLLLAVGGLVAWFVDRILVIPPQLIGDARLMMFLLFFSLAVQLPCGPMGLGLYVRQKFVMANLIQVCSEVTKSVVLLSLLLLVSTRVMWVVVAMVAAQMFALVVNLMASLRAIPALRFRYRPVQWDLVRAITGFGGWNFLVALAARTREYATPLILNHLGSAIDIASYQIGAMGRRQVDQWFDVAARPIHPIITGMHAMGAKERFRNAYLWGGRVGAWVILAVSLPAIIYSGPVISLYAGETYAAGAIVMSLTLAGYILSSGNWMAWCISAAKAQMRPLGIRACLTQAVGVVAILVLAGWWGLGAMGAAMASFVVLALSDVLLTLPLALRLAEVRLETWIEKTLIPGLAPGCVAAVVWVYLERVVVPDTWTEVGLCVAAGALCYVAVLLGCCLGPQDKQDLAMIWAKAAGRLRRGKTVPSDGPPDVATR